jgi:hypothetical protein
MSVLTGKPNEDGPEDRIWSGYRVVVDLVNEDGSSERLAFQIVPNELADFLQGYLGEDTPLGKAILGHKAGDRVEYQVEDIVEVRIVGAELADTGPDESVPERRLESLRKALKQTELANMIAFAASFNSKWGDYDPKSLSDEWEKNQ